MSQFIASDGTQEPERFVLVGDVVTMDTQRTVVRAARVCINAGAIDAVVPAGQPLPDPYRGAFVVETGGTLFPGLIALHDHLSYNMMPLWAVPRKFTNRSQWLAPDPSYQQLVAAPAKILGQNVDLDYLRAIVRFVECRSLFGGVTTTQGLTSNTSAGDRPYYNGVLRIAERPLNDWPAAEDQVLDYKSQQDVIDKLVPALQKPRPFTYHLSEGTDAAARQHFLDLHLPDGSWAINSRLTCIHCVGLQDSDFATLAHSAGMVWSPLSNVLLYGATANVPAALTQGVSLALGADWSPSGSKNLLGELKVARAVSQVLGFPLSNADIMAAVTSTPAKMLGWDRYVGSVQAGLRADLLVLDGQHTDPYAALISAKENSINAILIDGRPRLGSAELVKPSKEPTEPVRIGGRTYLVDYAEKADDPLTGMSLATATAKLAYGLWHLPELSESLRDGALLATDHTARTRPRLVLDFDPLNNLRPESVAARLSDAPLQRMVLDPITLIDDQQFKPRVLENPNVPGEIKEALSAAL
jgi:5-methylthioadenosine/S-adenosylhomocysteine deaminase